MRASTDAGATAACVAAMISAAISTNRRGCQDHARKPVPNRTIVGHSEAKSLVREEGLVPAARCARRDLRSRPALFVGGGDPPRPPEGSRPLLSHGASAKVGARRLVREEG